jgi:hypothetical protein
VSYTVAVILNIATLALYPASFASVAVAAVGEVRNAPFRKLLRI